MQIIIGLITILFPVWMIPVNLIFVAFSKKQSKYYLVYLALGLAMFALFFDMHGSAFDFSRYQNFMVSSSKAANPFVFVSQQGMFTEWSNYPLFLVLSWAIGKTGFYQLLSVVGVLFAYIIPVFVMQRNVDKVNFIYITGVFVVLTSSPALIVISGIRYFIGMGLLVLIVFYIIPFVSRRLGLIVLWTPLLVHSATAIFILLAYLVLSIKIKNILVRLTIISGVAFGFVMTLIGKIVVPGKIGNLLTTKLIAYSDANYVLPLDKIVINVPAAIVIVVFILLSVYGEKINDVDWAGIYWMMMYLIIYFFDRVMIERFTWFILPVVALLLIRNMSFAKNDSAMKYLLMLVYILLSLMVGQELFTQGLMYLLKNLLNPEIWTANIFSYFFS